MKAAGRNLTVGELRSELQWQSDNDLVVIDGAGPVVEAESLPSGLHITCDLTESDAYEILADLIAEIIGNASSIRTAQALAREAAEEIGITVAGDE